MTPSLGRLEDPSWYPGGTGGGRLLFLGGHFLKRFPSENLISCLGLLNHGGKNVHPCKSVQWGSNFGNAFRIMTAGFSNLCLGSPSILAPWLEALLDQGALFESVGILHHDENSFPATPGGT